MASTAEYFPYAVTRTWHTQCRSSGCSRWLAAGATSGLCLARAIPNSRSRVLSVGQLAAEDGRSLASGWRVNRMIPDLCRALVRTQGYGFHDLGRFWQIYLFIGLPVGLADAPVAMAY